jgi:hypothetical protein
LILNVPSLTGIVSSIVIDESSPAFNRAGTVLLSLTETGRGSGIETSISFSIGTVMVCFVGTSRVDQALVDQSSSFHQV